MLARHRTLLFNGRTVLFLMLVVGSRFDAQAQPKPSVAKHSNSGAVVPFVGCPADGQVGPIDAPKGESKAVQISKEAAERLVYYKAEDGPGVLGPLGWHCFETYGSNGSSLYLSAEPIDSATLFSDKRKGFIGPAIQISAMDGGTSGRFSVARTIARVFPSHKAFVRKVIAEDIEPASDFPFGPYPSDKLTYKSKDVVEYQTPGQMDGLGTQSRLQKNADSIKGVVILIGPQEEPSAVSLAVRLPSAMTDLAPAIIQQAEHEVASSQNR